MPLSRDLRQFVECLNSHNVEYLIVGALAVSWHGFPRYSADIDFFIRPSPENAARILSALRAFGFGGLPITAEDLITPEQVIQLGHEPNRIDLMTSISGLTFEEAWSTRTAGLLDGLPLQFIGHEALLRNKAASGRPKDLFDIEALRKPDPKDI
jgi:hypothetical protein